MFVGNDVVFVEPQRDFLLGIFDAVRAVADVAADVLKSQTLVINDGGGNRGGERRRVKIYDCVVAADGPWSRCKRIRSAKKSWFLRLAVERWRYAIVGGFNTSASLDGVTTFPHHGADWTA